MNRCSKRSSWRGEPWRSPPKFAFGWARVAELEFSFGRSGKALEAVERSLQLAPRNPRPSS